MTTGPADGAQPGLAFITTVDRPWDVYMEAFPTSGPTLASFDTALQHREGYGGRPDPAAVKSFVPGAEAPAA